MEPYAVERVGPHAASGGKGSCVSDEQNAEERWRKLAEETFFLSRQLSDSAARRIIFRIAEAYDGLADRAKVQSEQSSRRHDPRKANGR